MLACFKTGSYKWSHNSYSIWFLRAVYCTELLHYFQMWETACHPDVKTKDFSGICGENENSFQLTTGVYGCHNSSVNLLCCACVLLLVPVKVCGDHGTKRPLSLSPAFSDWQVSFFSRVVDICYSMWCLETWELSMMGDFVGQFPLQIRTGFLCCLALLCPTPLAGSAWRKLLPRAPKGLLRLMAAESHGRWPVSDDSCPIHCYCVTGLHKPPGATRSPVEPPCLQILKSAHVHSEEMGPCV